MKQEGLWMKDLSPVEHRPQGQAEPYLPHTHHSIGNQDHDNHNGLHKRRRGLLSFFKPGQDLVAKEKKEHNGVQTRAATF